MKSILARLAGALLLAALMVLPGASHARGCIVGPWVSADKTMHAAGTAAVVFGTDYAVSKLSPDTFRDMAYIGLLPGLGMAFMREFDKNSMGGRCEWASIAYDALGLAVGAASTRWLLLPEAHGVTVAYVRAF
jgi:hypothetical protein